MKYLLMPTGNGLRINVFWQDDGTRDEHCRPLSINNIILTSLHNLLFIVIRAGEV